MLSSQDSAHPTAARTVPRPPPAPPAPRLSLSPGVSALRIGSAELGHGPGPLDGAWWPKSRDLSLELPSLVGALDLLWGRITRVTVNPLYWPTVPKKVPVAGHVVHVGWFVEEQDPHKLLVLSYRTGRWDLLIVPPQTPAATAAWLMAAAADPANVRTASELMAQADPDRGADAAWEAEGGPAGLARPERAA
ncbi:DUF5994 family protein [Streptomyces sp. NPDC008139]|uniref:DUF5994 family protein n=1 Tax=Streptomyces sp. NPDC008139 TaxID=3364814 RepID=UPI0036E42344